MNYYEELGVSPQATGQEIRKAHRRLVKLMHPDAQPDPALKMLAETQMRRLNSIVSTLLDPEQRFKYDDSLRLSAEASQRAAPVLTNLGGIPWWITSSVAAIILTLGAVWVLADHLGSSSGRNSSRNIVYLSPEKYPTRDIRSPVANSSNAYSSSSSRAGGSVKANLDPPSISAPVSQESSPRGGLVSTVVSDPTPIPDKPAGNAPITQAVAKSLAPMRPVITPEAKKLPPPVGVTSRAKQKSAESNVAATPGTRMGLNDTPVKALSRSTSKDEKPKTMTARASDPPAPAPRKQFEFPTGTLIASAAPHTSGSQLPVPPGVSSQNHDDGAASMPALPLPIAVPPKVADVTTSASPATSPTVSFSHINRDPLEGEWIYAPKVPERRRAGFYPPEFIDLKIFGSGDEGRLKGQYDAKYEVTDRPVSAEISFQLASVSKGSRKFVWQSTTGAKGTLSIDPIDEHTIRIDWHTTSAIRGPALTAGQATLVRR